MTAQLLPELGKLLSHPEDPVVLEATKLFLELSKKDASCRALIGNGNIVSTLIQAMGSTMSAEIQKLVAGTLHNLSNDRYIQCASASVGRREGEEGREGEGGEGGGG